jgi:hypothetical protein
MSAGCAAEEKLKRAWLYNVLDRKVSVDRYRQGVITGPENMAARRAYAHAETAYNKHVETCSVCQIAGKKMVGKSVQVSNHVAGC